MYFRYTIDLLYVTKSLLDIYVSFELNLLKVIEEMNRYSNRLYKNTKLKNSNQMIISGYLVPLFKRNIKFQMHQESNIINYVFSALF